MSTTSTLFFTATFRGPLNFNFSTEKFFSKFMKYQEKKTLNKWIVKIFYHARKNARNLGLLTRIPPKYMVLIYIFFD